MKCRELGMHNLKEETNMKSTMKSVLAGVALAALGS